MLKILDDEIKKNVKSNGFIDDLQMFENNRAGETVVGLKAKLEKVGRGEEVFFAEMKKEYFSKLLMKFEHFPSAQKLFAYFLSRIHEVFETHIVPHASSLTRQEMEQIVENKIVAPTVADMGMGFEHFTLNESHIRGMIFWLADRCYIRWH
ncbi:hypothetical protein ELH02_12900 [Rhizobium ruizarguesonis]|uniref:ABC-three component systems C-terminal domain-containing protein n=1 Tax=Rhizobium ruizarguesonis TaxID=2081791 RepID=A0AAE5C262_9HYPH|nr:ABC-three component system protein [Rhizobium ruizarguesonis]NEI48615.1 hypothetical protein [Rhizobium ruizarguesonis]TBD00431.1 hypothetical protein ELH25_17925 [Rhizobium ruizarguesonis]TBD16579.1 hypothetical protein ELH24_14185 [Rhizobium ruizarguesonis]TBD38370.1 hypothetical protein ELH18_13325 [Rhizobium ruizarguesonis]TBD85707.1 hypothetical protein ELH13_13210 [Rhizobium ruizarguesonis]